MTEQNPEPYDPSNPFQEADVKRCFAAREGYIKWRMADVPAIYTSLMPVTACAKILWFAEQRIREQIETDQRHLANHWRQLGPRCNFLDFSGFTPEERIAFGLEVHLPAGATDVPKPDHFEELREEFEAMCDTPANQERKRELHERLARATDPGEKIALFNELCDLENPGLSDVRDDEIPQ